MPDAIWEDRAVVDPSAINGEQLYRKVDTVNGVDADGQPKYRPVKQVEYPESQWDETKWGKSSYLPVTRIPQKDALEIFMLTPGELARLTFTRGQKKIAFPPFITKTNEYLGSQVEQLAWQKFGGPTGYNAARKKRLRERKGKKALKAAAASAQRGEEVGPPTPPQTPRKKKAVLPKASNSKGKSSSNKGAKAALLEAPSTFTPVRQTPKSLKRLHQRKEVFMVEDSDAEMAPVSPATPPPSTKKSRLGEFSGKGIKSPSTSTRLGDVIELTDSGDEKGGRMNLNHPQDDVIYITDSDDGR